MASYDPTSPDSLKKNEKKLKMVYFEGSQHAAHSPYWLSRMNIDLLKRKIPDHVSFYDPHFKIYFFTISSKIEILNISSSEDK